MKPVPFRLSYFFRRFRHTAEPGGEGSGTGERRYRPGSAGQAAPAGPAILCRRNTAPGITRFTAADRTATGSGNVLSGFLPPGTCLFILNLICHSNCSMPGEIRQGNSAFPAGALLVSLTPSEFVYFLRLANFKQRALLRLLFSK